MAFLTATVTQGSGLTINTLPNAGQATMANSRRVEFPRATSTATSSVIPADGDLLNIGLHITVDSVPIAA